MGKKQTGMDKEKSTHMGRVSIVMSTYNRADRLKRAIKSIVGQTYPNWELIVVDDASKDNTENVVKSFKDERIKYIKRKENFGNDTRPKNEGIMQSTGEYVAFLDDDNEFRPDHLAVLLKGFKEDDRYDVYYGDRWLTDDTGNIQPQLGFSRDFDPAMLMQRNFIDTSDVLIKRQALFDVGGWDERYKKYVDWNLWVRLLKYGKHFKRIPQVITDYHLHENMKSLTVKDRNEKGGTSLPLGNSPSFTPEWDAFDLEVELGYLGNKPRLEPKVAIYTLTYDRLEYTKKSFKSLQETAGYPFEHFVVDNGSSDGTVEFLQKNFKKDHLVLNKDNKGISKGSNQALELIKEGGRHDIILKWDNDAIGLTKNWLKTMVELWKVNHNLALSCYVQGLIDNPGGAPRLAYGTVKNELLGITKHLGGICVFVDARVYEKFRWDDGSFLHGVQDMEFSQHLVFSGFTLAYLENYFISHGILGTEQQKKDYKNYFDRRKEEKMIRYGTEEHKKYAKRNTHEGKETSNRN